MAKKRSNGNGRTWTEEEVEAKRAQNLREGKPPYAGIPGNWTPERRAAHGRKVAAAMRKRWRIHHRDVDAFVDEGEVHESLRAIIAMRSNQAGQILEDLGKDASTIQVAAVDGWTRSQVAADALLTAFLRNPDPSRVVERFATLQSLALKHLSALGVRPRAAEQADALRTIVEGIHRDE